MNVIRCNYCGGEDCRRIIDEIDLEKYKVYYNKSFKVYNCPSCESIFHFEENSVRPISRGLAERFFLSGHYLGKWPRISYLFGFFKDSELVGAISYGTTSPAVRKSVVSEPYQDNVIELNRLFLLDNEKNQASYFISKTLRMLPKPSIVVSYADNGAGHSGGVYRASNFIYGGKSESYHKDWTVRGKEHMHPSTLFREFRHDKNKVEKMKEKYGDRLYRKARSPKDRFVFVCAKKGEKKRIEKELKWK